MKENIENVQSKTDSYVDFTRNSSWKARAGIQPDIFFNDKYMEYLDKNHILKAYTTHYKTAFGEKLYQKPKSQKEILLEKER